MAEERVLESTASRDAFLEAFRNLRTSATDDQPIRIRGANLRGSDFKNIDFHSCIFEGGDFSACDFSGAKLQGTEFRNVALSQAIFRSADLDGAEFDAQCDCFKADFSGADAARAKFLGTKLNEAVFTGADLVDADFSGAKLRDASFERAKLFRVKGFRPDHTNIRGAMFSAGAPDDWSRLKRNYTGIRLVLNLAGLGVFVAAISAKAFGLYGAALVQAASADSVSAYAGISSDFGAVLSSFCRQAGSPCREVQIWQVLLGLTQSWFAFAYITASLVSNGVRFGLTLAISQMEQEEDKSGYTPDLEIRFNTRGRLLGRLANLLAELPKSYGWIVPVDQVMSWGRWVLLALLIASLWDLAMTTIILPA